MMTTDDIILRAKTSPALKWQSNKPGNAAYPANYRGRVPLKVKMAKTVTPDLTPNREVTPGTVCWKDKEYYVWVNSYGAVTAILPNGEDIGLRPSEFDITEWHDIPDMPSLTKCTGGHWKVGKHSSILVSDVPVENTLFPFPPGSQPDDTEHYGGYLIAESIANPWDAKMMASSKDMAEAIKYYFDVLKEVNGDVWDKHPDHVLQKFIDAYKKATE